MKHIYVFGAGASHASADTPLGKDLIWDYFEQCSTLYRIERGVPAEDDLQEKREEFINYHQFLQLTDALYPELDEVKKWHTNMIKGEVYFSPKDRNKRYYFDDLLKKFIEKNNNDGIRLIRQLILEHITEAAKASSNGLYKKFLSYLFQQKQENISIITLNFDTLLLDSDYAQPVRFNYGIEFDYKDTACDEWYHHQNGVLLLKLNGSLDWGVCENCQKVACLPPTLNKRSYETHRCQMTKQCTGILSPLIILPHQATHAITKTLLEQAKKELASAETITIIGYSFPEYDAAIKTLFRDNVKQNAKIEVVDVAKPENQTILKRRFEDIFEPRKILISYDGFEGYLNRRCVDSQIE